MPDLPAGVLRPPHAYVPGKTARHPEGWFDPIKADVATAEALDQTLAWRAGLAYLNAGYFWECHEVLEAVWLRTADPSCERDMVQALIQLANARLKMLMDRPKAANRLFGMVRDHLARLPKDRPILGLLRDDVASWLDDQVLK